MSVIVTSDPVEVVIDPTLVEVVIEAPATEITLAPEVTDVVINPSLTELVVSPLGMQGPPGPTELVDALVPPIPGNVSATYLRFERDDDGDVQAIYLGTAD